MDRLSSLSDNKRLITNGRSTLLRGLIFAGILSAFINLLQLLVPLYMLQVHDRVLNSRSMDTLTMLSMLAVGGLLVFGVLEFIRSTTMLTLGAQFVRRLNLPLIEASLSNSLQESSSKGSQALRDLSEIRTFFSRGAAGAPLEAVWTPIFMLVLTAFHPIYGLLAVISAVLIIAFSLAGDLVSKTLLKEANNAQIDVIASVGGSLRQAEAIDAMGMLPQLGRRWQRAQNAADRMFGVGMRRNKIIAAMSRTVRYIMQIATLAVGAILVIDQAVTPGTIMAATILMGRTLQPFDSMIENWRQWRSAGSAWKRIQTLLEKDGAERETTPLPRPEGRLVVEQLVYAVPGSSTPLIRNLDFALEPGEVLGVLGASATGKSTLARLFVGVVKPASGGVFLGGHNVNTWERGSFGRAVGYLPQSVALLDGTIRENISRLNDDDPAAVIKAARIAGVHEMIGRLPLGYDTPVGDLRMTLSGGQKQRVGIARAIYGDPRLVVMDEPNSNLDAEGEQDLMRAIARLKADGAIVIVVAHRSAILQVADKLLVLQKDRSWQFGSATALAATISGPSERFALSGGKS